MRTPAYQPLESPPHYILRLSEANGYLSPAVVMQLAVPGEDCRVPAKWDYAHLNTLLPESRHTPLTFTYRWPTSTHRCDLSLLGRPILSRHMNAIHAGVCPECIKELGFAPAWWDLRYAIACPTHRRMFVFRCPGCGEQVSLFRRRLLTCSCGATLAQDIDHQPSTALLWLVDLLKHKVEDGAPSGGPDIKPARPLRPEEATLGTLCTIIETIGRAERRMTGVATTQLVVSQRRCLPAAASFLYDWPHGAFAFCSRWRDYNTAVRRESDLDLRAAFAWAFLGLFRNQHEKRRDTLFVMDAVLQYVSSALPGRAVDIRANDLRQLPQEEPAYYGLAKAARLSRVPRHTIIRMIRRKRIACRVSHRGTRSIFEIRADVVRNLRLNFQPALLYRQGAKRLGVTHSVYRDLRRAGMLKKQHETMMPQAIAVCDLDDFKGRVFAHARKATRRQGLRSLDQLRRSKCPRPAMIAILQSILRGTIQPSYTGTAPQRINDLLVRPGEIEPIITRFARKRPPTARELQARYRLGSAEVRALLRHLSDALNAAKRVRPTAADAAKLGEFMARYIGVEAYADAQRVGYRAALSRLQHDNATVLQICAAGSHGRYVYFVPRDVLRAQQPRDQREATL